MKPDSSGSMIDRVVDWLRGLFSAGKSATGSAARDVRRSTHDARTTVRKGVDSAERKARDVSDRRDAASDAAADRRRQGLPDLADESSGGGRSTFGDASDTPSSLRDTATTYSTDGPGSTDVSDEDIDRRSDFDDAAGDLETGTETYPQRGSDLDAAGHIHDAVGGADSFADDSIDGTIDTTRDSDLRPGGTEGYQDREIPLQDQLVIDEGASSDEFDGDEVTRGDTDTSWVTREEVESAASGANSDDTDNLANTSAEGTSSLTGSTFTETDINVPPSGEHDTTSHASSDKQDDAGSEEGSGDFHVVERYNYGMGDMGVGAGTTPDEAWSQTAGPDVTTSDLASEGNADSDDVPQDGDVPADTSGDADTMTSSAPSDTIDASVSPDATRTEIESQSLGDAVNRSDEATQTPGFGDPETFDQAAAGTTEPSRSATGNDLDEHQDALGTTLDYSDESDTFDDETANLSDQGELGVSDSSFNERASAGVEDRVTTFQSGTIAHDGLVAEDTVIDKQVTTDAYADLPDDPDHETADDAGVDDFSGSDYPSDRRVDTLAGDDFTDAEMPDVTDLDSSEGDLDAFAGDASEEIDAVTAPADRLVGDAGQQLDQDLVGTSDEHIGGEEPDVAEMGVGGTGESSAGDVDSAARSADDTLSTGMTETSGVGISDIDLGAGDSHDMTESDPALEGSESAFAPGSSSQTSRPGSDESGPSGSVRGDGGTEAPDGYPVKGNANSMIYHLPDFPSYAGTKAEYYFATEEDAAAAGYRAPGNIRRAGGAAAASVVSAAEDVTGGTSTVISGDETSHVAPGEVAFDHRLGDNEGGDDAPDAASDEAEIPAGAVRGDGTTETPEGYPVKGNASSMIYHIPSFPSYKSTKAEFCFATEEDALTAGYRAPGKRNRGRKS